MTETEAREHGLGRWVLRLAESQPPRYLADYRHHADLITTADLRCAESFWRAIDANEMRLRIRWISKVEWIVESVVADAEPLCALDGCDHVQADDSTMCCRHRDMGYREAVRELANRLTDDQITEAALHAAKEDTDADVLELLAHHFDLAEDSDETAIAFTDGNVRGMASKS